MGVSRYHSVEAAWAARTTPADNGHLTWTGAAGTSARTPIFTWHDKTYSAAAVAFRIRTGRDPQGYCAAECGRKHCIAPAHVEDTPGRTRLREQLRAIVGIGPRQTTCRRGHDQNIHGRLDGDGIAYCNTCINERRAAA
jgi:hypothetical protein